LNVGKAKAIIIAGVGVVGFKIIIIIKFIIKAGVGKFGSRFDALNRRLIFVNVDRIPMLFNVILSTVPKNYRHIATR